MIENVDIVPFIEHILKNQIFPWSRLAFGCLPGFGVLKNYLKTSKNVNSKGKWTQMRLQMNGNLRVNINIDWWQKESWHNYKQEQS